MSEADAVRSVRGTSSGGRLARGPSANEIPADATASKPSPRDQPSNQRPADAPPTNGPPSCPSQTSGSAPGGSLSGEPSPSGPLSCDLPASSAPPSSDASRSAPSSVPSSHLPLADDPLSPPNVPSSIGQCAPCSDSFSGRSQLATMKLDDMKAGMEGLDTDKINQIIEETSRGSKFYNHKKHRQQKIDERIKRMLEQKAAFTPEQLRLAEAQMDELAAQLELRRDMSRFIVHVDMDAFYAAVEMRDRPELRDVPMAVGSTSMLSTSNYAARRFGVRAAMPGFIGRKLCPQLVIVPCSFDKYRAASQLVQAVLARYDPNFSMASLDEAYLDITDKVHREQSTVDGSPDLEDSQQTEDDMAQALVLRMRTEIQQATRLTASAGIACNGMLAKICSDHNKPNGQFFLARDRAAVLDFLAPLPVRKVSGIGNVLSQQLAALGVTVCGQLLQQHRLLRLLFSDSCSEFLLRAGLGVQGWAGAEAEERHQKSLSTETTFADTADAARLAALLRRLCGQLAAELADKRLLGRTVTLKVKTSAFAVRTRAETLAEPTAAAEALLAATRPALTRELAAGQPLRLLGVRMSGLVAAEEATGRRQATLAEMAGRAAADHACPVCGRRCTSLAQLTVHVDRCLDGEPPATAEEPPATAEEPPRQRDDSASRAECEVGGGSVAVPPAGDAAGAAAAAVGANNWQLADTRVSSSGGADPGGPQCPVCERPLPDALDKVNRHLDECLNQQLLSQLTGGSEPRGVKRSACASAAPTVKHKRIDRFFPVKK